MADQSVTTPVKKERSLGQNVSLGIGGAVIVFLCIISICLSLGSSTDKITNPTSTLLSIFSTPIHPTIIVPTLSPDEKVKTLVTGALGEGNRDVPRLTSLDWDAQEKWIYVEWTINDSLTNDWIVYNAKRDIIEILKTFAADDNPYDYQLITVDGTFSLQDLYGNVTEDQVIVATYMRSEIEKVNWDNFSADNVYLIADEYHLHPLFSESGQK